MSIEHSLNIRGEMFPIQHFFDYWRIQNEFVLEYVFEAMKVFKREGLFLYCMDTELCYFRADGSVQMNDERYNK